MDMHLEYIVVLEGNGKGMYSGTRCIVDYGTAENLEAHLSDIKDIVIAKGVSIEDARRLIREVSGATMAWAAFHRGVTEGHMDMHILNHSYSAQDSGKGYEFHEQLIKIVVGASDLAALMISKITS